MNTKRFVFLAVIIITSFITTAVYADKAKPFTFSFGTLSITMGDTKVNIGKIINKTIDSSQSKIDYKIGRDKIVFEFNGDSLVKVSLSSESTEGPSNTMRSFDKWLEKKYGKGKDKQEQAVVKTFWKIKDCSVEVMREWYASESGDSFTSFKITLK